MTPDSPARFQEEDFSALNKFDASYWGDTSVGMDSCLHDEMEKFRRERGAGPQTDFCQKKKKIA